MTGGGRLRPRVVLAFVRHGANVIALGRAQSDLDETVALSVVRGFATHLHALDPANGALLRTPLRRVTFATLIGLLSVRYVGKTDVTAYYEFVDHELLEDELLSQTGEEPAITLRARVS